MRRLAARTVPFSLAAIAAVLFSAAPALAGHHKHGDGDEKKDKPSIVEIASSHDDFSTLVTALKAADLVDALSEKGKKFTVFAPTNAAFDKLPDGTLESLLKPENKEKLRSILLYHVASGKVKAKKVVEMDAVQTLQGSSLNVQVDGDTVKVDNANVVKTDIWASNGVIHVIDAVAVPSE